MNTQDITQEQITEARDWASDCLGMVAETVTFNRALKYITANYEGGWNAFVAEVCVDATVPAAAESESNGTIWVCQDCMLHHANGECGSCSDLYGPHDEEPLSSIGDGFHVAMGMAYEEHSEDCETRIQGQQPDNYECDCETNTYSTSQCDGCGSWLHGERHGMTLFKA